MIFVFLWLTLTARLHNPSQDRLVRPRAEGQPAHSYRAAAGLLVCAPGLSSALPTPFCSSPRSHSQEGQQPRTLVVPPGLEGGVLDTYGGRGSMKGKCSCLMKEGPVKTSPSKSSHELRQGGTQGLSDWR